MCPNPERARKLSSKITANALPDHRESVTHTAPQTLKLEIRKYSAFLSIVNESVVSPAPVTYIKVAAVKKFPAGSWEWVGHMPQGQPPLIPSPCLMVSLQCF